MTNQDQYLTKLRIRVAELCGCKRYKRPWDGRVFLCLEQPGTKEKVWHVTLDPVDVVNSDVPDYPNDLNACHEFEKTLEGDALVKFDIILARICADGYHEHKTHWSPRVSHATAEQRCRAFVALHDAQEAR